MMKILTSFKFAMVCGLTICILAMAGSFSPRAIVIYDSWPFIALWILFSTGLTAYLIQVIKRPSKNIYQWGLILLHSGILLVLLATAGNRLWGFEGTVHLREGIEQNVYLKADGSTADLGFTVKCDDFHVEYYDDTDRVKAYKTLFNAGDGESFATAEIDVNRPFTYNGVTFYQQSYGFTPSNTGRLIFTAVVNGVPSQHDVFFDEPVLVADGIEVEIADFSPALAFTPDGQAYSFSDTQMFNPSALFLIDEQGKRFLRWISARSTESGLIDEDLMIIFEDFWGVEYTTLALSKKQFSSVIYLGFVIMATGFAMIYLPRMGKK